MPCHTPAADLALMFQEIVVIERHVPLARDTYRLRLPCPAIAARILPGQFLMFRLPGTNDPLLGRPLALYDTYRAAVGVCVSTDDGSAGHRGTVVELVPPLVEASELPCRIVACGPEKMLHATVEMAARLGLGCQVSLESPMACGIGICFSCVTKI